MLVLGLDPGYAIVGFGIVDSKNNKMIDYGIISTPKEMPMSERLLTIYKGVKELIDNYKIEEVAIEELFFNTNTTTAVSVAQARGVLILACKQCIDKLYEYTPLQIKQALTGVGRAEKKQVQYMVKSILGLNTIPKPDDAADALAVALCHIQTNNALSDNSI